MDPSDLYGLPLERFTPERNQLAKELRRAGRRDEAARVSKLRKPSVAAWAVNQLVRTQRGEVDRLFQAGDALQTAQMALLEGRGDSRRLRDAVDTERGAVDALTSRARGLLSGDGHELTPARVEQVSETLHAAALDAEARSQLRDGCLVRELRHVGLGALGPGSSPRPRDRRSADKQPQLRAARMQEAAARRRHAQAERALAAAEERRERAASQLETAEREVAEARAAAEAAAREHRKAEQELSALG